MIFGEKEYQEIIVSTLSSPYTQKNPIGGKKYKFEDKWEMEKIYE